MIAYTIGRASLYDALDENTNKIGQTEGYLGSWIWKTKEAATEFINSKEFADIKWGDNSPIVSSEFSVYGVKINSWEKDVYIPENETQYHLLNDSLIVKLT